MSARDALAKKHRSKSLSIWIPVITAIVTAVLAGTGFLIQRHLDRPPAITGYAARVGSPVVVTLDNGVFVQTADPQTGFFRFAGVDYGRHVVQAAAVGFQPRSVVFEVHSAGDNLIADNFSLDPEERPIPEPIEVNAVPQKHSVPDGRR